MIKIKKIKLILILIALPILIFAVFKIYQASRQNEVQASGAFTIYVDGKIMKGKPIFNYSNIEPGNKFFHDVKIKNNNTVPVYAKVIAERVSGNGDLETQLKTTINNGSTDKFSGSLKDLFNLQTQSGVTLDVIQGNAEKTYHFNITFDPSSGNNFQDTNVIFDLDFGTFSASDLVINEVYYNVDSKHGDDSFKDRFISAVEEKDKNRDVFNFKINGKCLVFEKNFRDNYRRFSFSYFFNFYKFNYSVCNEHEKGHNDEWVEIYNPTKKDISLKNWTLSDNSGNSTKITSNKIIKAGGFALISKDADTWNFWKVTNKSVVKVELGSDIGDGLDNEGDHLILKNPNGKEVDKVGWGNDTTVWNPAIVNGPDGSSIERITPGFDFDLSTDWVVKKNPTPGN